MKRKLLLRKTTIAKLDMQNAQAGKGCGTGTVQGSTSIIATIYGEDYTKKANTGCCSVHCSDFCSDKCSECCC